MVHKSARLSTSKYVLSQLQYAVSHIRYTVFKLQHALPQLQYAFSYDGPFKVWQRSLSRYYIHAHLHYIDKFQSSHSGGYPALGKDEVILPGWMKD